jgi:hypothetical protein
VSLLRLAGATAENRLSRGDAFGRQCAAQRFVYEFFLAAGKEPHYGEQRNSFCITLIKLEKINYLKRSLRSAESQS